MNDKYWERWKMRQERKIKRKRESKTNIEKDGGNEKEKREKLKLRKINRELMLKKWGKMRQERKYN